MTTWLTVDGQRVAPLEVATTRKARRRGLLGRSGIDGAMLLRPGDSIHTFRMRFAIDAALCDRDLRVVKTLTLPAGRLTCPRRKVRAVVEAEAGSFERWGLHHDSQLGISDGSGDGG